MTNLRPYTYTKDFEPEHYPKYPDIRRTWVGDPYESKGAHTMLTVLTKWTHHEDGTPDVQDIDVREVRRVSYFHLPKVDEEGNKLPTLSAGLPVAVPEGLLREHQLRYRFAHNSAEAFFLLWLAKRMPSSSEVSFLPPSNHKEWSDRTWKLFRLLVDTLGQ
jgi:hypothetical protein